MNIRIRNAGPATILDLDGPLKLGKAEEAFRNQIQQLVDAGTKHIAVNLAGVSDLDSSGIGALVRAFTTLKRAGGRCTCGESKRVIGHQMRKATTITVVIWRMRSAFPLDSWIPLMLLRQK